MEILKNPNNMAKKTCNNCPFAEWSHIYSGEYNLKCTKLNKFVDYGIIKETDEVESPIWCPETFGTDAKSDLEIPSTTNFSSGFRGTDGKWYTPTSNGLLRCEDGNCYLPSEVSRPSSLTEQNYMPQIKEKRLLWDDVTPRVNWNSIQVNDIYHIPPHMGKQRFDIRITGIFPASISYTLVGSSTYTTYYMYKNDLIYKLMTKHEIKF